MTLATKVARLAKPKPPTEYEIHAAVVTELRRRAAPGVRFWHTPNEGRRSAKYAAGLAAMGVSAGVPDLMLVRSESWRCIECGTLTPGVDPACDCWRDLEPVPPASAALELKRRGEKPRDTQRAWLEHLAAAGWLTGWADSVERAIALLEEWGMLAHKGV